METNPYLFEALKHAPPDGHELRKEKLVRSIAKAQEFFGRPQVRSMADLMGMESWTLFGLMIEGGVAEIGEAGISVGERKDLITAFNKWKNHLAMLYEGSAMSSLDVADKILVQIANEENRRVPALFSDFVDCDEVLPDGGNPRREEAPF